MIEINAALDPEGLLERCSITGHAGAGPRGNDIVCAAVSVLARTGSAVLSERPGIKVRQTAPNRGLFQMDIECDPAEKSFLDAAGTFLLEGLVSVSKEYPDYCNIVITRRNYYGSETRRKRRQKRTGF
ncbi:MAG: ribosomal-processing cysteine protease Prp [Spirochaetaceae bacterium]|jgi:uncharacterized protein YsxB (DUF464 family)|nr:ribosomal-processing cysteine protease Prp [Spirochaetaceae bacterium]